MSEEWIVRQMTAAGIVLAVLLVACSGGDVQIERGGTITTTETSAQSPPTSTTALLAPPASALDDPQHESFPDPLVDPREVISGGPPPDGIPPIDDPRFVTVGEAAAYLTSNEPIVYVDVDGDVRGYPVQILIWHEIVNDTVGGLPVAVTYCPLCNSAVAYERLVDGQTTTFGTSGRLYNSALVMYDRATESLWTHYDGRAVIGTLTGTQLNPIPAPLIGWADFRSQFPDARVLDRERTGHSRAYGDNPYAGYDDPDATPFLFRGDVDDRARLMQRVVGVAVGEAAAAWTLDALQAGSSSVTHGTVGGQDIVIFWKEGQATALESFSIDGGRDVGSVGVFVPDSEGMALTFSPTADGFRDTQTGSVWTITGHAIEGELSGSQLEAIPHLDTFWFAWSSYRPGTEFIES